MWHLLQHPRRQHNLFLLTSSNNNIFFNFFFFSEDVRMEVLNMNPATKK